MTTTARKYILGTLIVILVIVAIPLTIAFAAGSKDTATPPAPATPDPATVTARLELVYARQQMIFTRNGQAVSNYDNMTQNVQKLLDRARLKGKDVSAVQAAFDTFKTAFVNGEPVYEQGKTILSAHAGFDANGKVIDIGNAKATVKSLRDNLKQYRDLVHPARLALRDAVQAYRQSNPRPTSISTQP